MSHVTEVPYTGSYSASGHGVDPDAGAYTIKSKGSLTATLTHHADGSVSGTWSYSGSYTASSKYGSDTGATSGSGTVSGSPSSLQFIASGGAFVDGVGQLATDGKKLTASFDWIISGGGGSASGSLSGDPGPVPTIGDLLSEVVSIPAQVEVTTTKKGQGTEFVSPQYNFDSATGAWSLKELPVPGSYPPSSATFFQGTDKESYLNGVSQTFAWAAILSRDAGAPKVVQDVYGSASAATTLYNIETSYLHTVLDIIGDAPGAIVSGTESELLARIDSSNAKLRSDLNQAVEDVVVDSIAAKNKAVEYIVNFYRSVKTILSHSTEFFTVQTGSDPFLGEGHEDTMIGSDLNDKFSGGAGNDVAFGMLGNDNLLGGEDNDGLNGGSGNDKLDGGNGDDNLNGDEGNDNLAGGAGDDSLDGGNGNDNLAGGVGNDLYYINDTKPNSATAADVISEKVNEGTDTAHSSINYTLDKNVEILVLDGATDLSGTGNSSNNTITGNAGVNILNGKEGNDLLTGGDGADTFRFDTKLGAANVDTISDFISDADTIFISKKLLGKYQAGNDFVSEAGAIAHYSTDRFLYDTATGTLSYDADGNGPKEAMQFATLTGAPILVASDLHIY